MIESYYSAITLQLIAGRKKITKTYGKVKLSKSYDDNQILDNSVSCLYLYIKNILLSNSIYNVTITEYKID